MNRITRLCIIPWACTLTVVLAQVRPADARTIENAPSVELEG